ncbi:MAG: hypothetical protein GX550_00850 [Syntrophomonadaceae bacterium]|nr:hypothetical protein [Syntrophomonadaceae bacterium]
MDDLVKSLAASIINKLDEIENHVDLASLLITDSIIRTDAKLLHDEISRLIACLKAM